MNLIVVGCGRVRAKLSHHLFKHGHQVVAVDSNKEAVYDPPTPNARNIFSPSQTLVIAL